jgi:hypothetical protein
VTDNRGIRKEFGSRGGRFPLRPADRLWEDPWIDPEDWVDDLLPEVAGRAGYSLEQLESNPLFGRVQAVGDLVKFITLQPNVASGHNMQPWLSSLFKV